MGAGARGICVGQSQYPREVYGRMMTVGSMSVRMGHMMLKQAGANARCTLVRPRRTLEGRSRIMPRAGGR